MCGLASAEKNSKTFARYRFDYTTILGFSPCVSNTTIAIIRSRDCGGKGGHSFGLATVDWLSASAKWSFHGGQRQWLYERLSSLWYDASLQTLYPVNQAKMDTMQNLFPWTVLLRSCNISRLLVFVYLFSNGFSLSQSPVSLCMRIVQTYFRHLRSFPGLLACPSSSHSRGVLRTVPMLLWRLWSAVVEVIKAAETCCPNIDCIAMFYPRIL